MLNLDSPKSIQGLWEYLHHLYNKENDHVPLTSLNLATVIEKPVRQFHQNGQFYYLDKDNNVYQQSHHECQMSCNSFLLAKRVGQLLKN